MLGEPQREWGGVPPPRARLRARRPSADLEGLRPAHPSMVLSSTGHTRVLAIILSLSGVVV